MSRFKMLAIIVGLFVMFSGTATAAGAKFSAKPWTYDPDKTGIVAAHWRTHGGLPDAGKSNHALYLQKDGPTGVNAAAGASIEGVAGITLNELGFDYRNGGHCGAGAPRFNVYTSAGTYFFGCVHGDQAPAPDDPANWTRVRFQDADAFPAGDVPPWPGFGTVVITGIDIVFDEGTDVGPGYALLDNIDINGTLIGKAGNAK